MIKLNKKTIWIIVLLLVCGLVFSGEVMAGKAPDLNAPDPTPDPDPDPDPEPETETVATEQIKDGLLPDEPDVSGFKDDSDLYIGEPDELADAEAVYDKEPEDEPEEEYEAEYFREEIFEYLEGSAISPEFNW